MTAAATQGVVEAIIYVQSEQLRQTLRRTLRDVGVAETYVAGSRVETVAQLKEKPLALFILDWDAAPRDAAFLLYHAQDPHYGNSRPIVLICHHIGPQVVATAAEHYVARVFTEELTQSNIHKCLEAVWREEAARSPLRESLRQVGEARGRGDWHEAERALQDLHHQDPDNPRVLAEMAENLLQQDDWERAQTYVERIAEAKPPFLRALHILGRCYMKAGRFDAAHRVLAGAQLLNPHHVERLVHLGSCLLQLDRPQEAREAFVQALDLEKGHEPARVGQCQSLLLGDDINAALELLRGMASEREVASIFNTAAVIAIRHDRFAHGMHLYDVACGLIKTDKRVEGRVWFNKGIGFYRWQKLEEAREAFRQALRLDPGMQSAQHNLAVLERRQSVAVASSAGNLDTLGTLSERDDGDDLADMLDDGNLDERL